MTRSEVAEDRMARTPRAALWPLPLRAKVRLATELLAAYVRVRWRLRRDGLSRTVSYIQERAPARGPWATERHDDYITGLRLSHAVVRTLRLLPTDSRCLTQSLVLTTALARRGIESSFVIGVCSEGDFSAHAWVEHDGLPLLPPQDDVYQRLLEVSVRGDSATR